jgi:hypothetical protein
MTTHLYLDIDGVLNAWQRGRNHPLAAPAFGTLIGLEGSEDWPVLEAVKGTGRNWTKWNTIRRHFNATQPDVALWIDDYLALNRRALRWAKYAGVLAWAPEGFHGITPSRLGQPLLPLLHGQPPRPWRMHQSKLQLQTQLHWTDKPAAVRFG